MTRPPSPIVKEDNHWDEKWRKRRKDPLTPSSWLIRSKKYLPLPGKALDLASGRGSNSLYLAEQGWEMVAVDRSMEALHQTKEALAAYPSSLTVQLDLCQQQPPIRGCFDLILALNFLHRPLFPWIKDRLSPGGLFIGQSFSRVNTEPNTVLNPEYTLEKDEFPVFFSGWEILSHQQGEGRARNGASFASLIARKPID